MTKQGSFSDFNSLLDKATNPMQLEPDCESLKKICYLIDKGVVESAYAVQALYGKMTDENPHTVLFALKVLEKIFYECGNLAHRVICTEDFMCLLKDIVETTQQKLIRNKILELVQTWADMFKHFPQYSAPEKLLRNLQADGYVFPGFGNDVVYESKKQQCDINIAAISLCDKSESVNKDVLKKNNCNNKDSGIDSDADMRNREDYVIQSMREIREKKKRDFKQHQKCVGLPTSSDEEDSGVVSKEKESQAVYEENYSKFYGLPAELRAIKESRRVVEKDLQEYRNSKKEEFKQKKTYEYNGSNEILQLRNPEEQCLTCEKYKKKCNHDNTIFERSAPRLHPDLRKVKESREVVNNSFEEIKKQKHQAFYAAKLNDSVDKRSYKSYKNEEIENKQLQRALELSQTDTNSFNLRKPRTRLEEMEEQKALEEVLRLSLLETGPNQSTEDDELQLAIDRSVAEAEEENFSAFPKLGNNDDDNIILSYITELSLDDSYEKEHKLAELYAEYDDVEPCVICRTETKFLKSFMPCNHKCICNDCSEMYNAQLCPICRAYYTSITF